MRTVGASFANDMKRFSKALGMTLDQTHRGVVIKLFSAVIMVTPVDKGFLRGGWTVSQGTPSSGKKERRDPTGGQAMAEVHANPGKGGTVTYMTNAMPYAVVAEYGLWGQGPGATIKTTRDGYSVQAPSGMVRINVQRFQTIVKQVVSQSSGRRAS